MSTIATRPPPALSHICSTGHRLTAGLNAWHCAAGLAVVMAMALPLRLWGLRAPFESSDQAAMAHMVLYAKGMRWMFAHQYGPVLPILQKAWAETAVLVGIPLTESVFRGLTVLLDLAQVLVTWLLMRRLRCTRGQAFLGMLCCAALPAMVSNAHFAWSHMSAWLLAGTIALWATLAYFHDRKWWQLLLAGLALTAHCLSSAIAFGLPLVLLVAWIARWRRREVGTQTCLLEFMAGFTVPCLMALLVIAGSWHWTGEGQIGHLIAKFKTGSGGWRFHQVAHVPAMWTEQFGYLFGLVAAAGLIRATRFRHSRTPSDGRGVLALWAWSSLVPFVLIADWNRIGYAGAYVIETAYCAALLGALLTGELYDRFSNCPPMRAVVAGVATLALSHLAFGAADACLAGQRWAAWTGVSVPWGMVRADTGIKAAGDYVRRHVPPDAIVLSLHTNKGMEVSVAEFYTGRHVLATYDLPAGVLDELSSAMRADVDVLIVPEENRVFVASFDEFETVCTVRRGAQPVRHVFARRDRPLPHVDQEAGPLNRQYDAAFVPQQIPLALSAPPGYQPVKEKYKAVVTRLRKPGP